eukprot:6165664-Prymnesium_polylepis.1
MMHAAPSSGFPPATQHLSTVGRRGRAHRVRRRHGSLASPVCPPGLSALETGATWRLPASPDRLSPLRRPPGHTSDGAGGVMHPQRVDHSIWHRVLNDAQSSSVE